MNEKLFIFWDSIGQNPTISQLKNLWKILTKNQSAQQQKHQLKINKTEVCGQKQEIVIKWGIVKC